MASEWAYGASKRLRLAFLVVLVSVFIGVTGCSAAMYRHYGRGPVVVDDVQYLSGYGEWVNVTSYGMVWRPRVVSGWEPFYYGHWVWTTDGWAWVSYEPYGWLVFHYGNWAYQPAIGWFWIPGYVWSPARVQWYTFGAYTAWAPLPPPGVVWHDPWDPYDYNVWIVIDIDNFTKEDVGRHRIVRPITRDIANREAIVKRSPDVQRVEQITKRKVPLVKVGEREVNVRARTPAEAPTSVRTDESRLKRMVLPQAQKRKVEQRAARIEREVLAPQRRVAEQPEKTSAREKAGQQEKKSTRERTDTQKRKVKSR
jgi:hypothetical protein